jgi:hypothetical protein
MPYISQTAGEISAATRARSGAGETEPAKTATRRDRRSRRGRSGSANIKAAIVGTRFTKVTRSASISRSASDAPKSNNTLRAPYATPLAIQKKPARPKAGRAVMITSFDVMSKASDAAPSAALLKCVST